MSLWLLLAVLFLVPAQGLAEQSPLVMPDPQIPELQELQKLQTLPTIPKLTDAQRQNLERLAKHPIVQNAGKLITDAKFSENLTKLISHPNREKLLYTEILWFIVIFLLRARILHNTEHWFRALLHRLWTGAALMLGASYLAPVFWLGEPFKIVLSMLWQVFQKQ